MSEPVDYAFLHGGGQGGWTWAETIEALRLQTGGAFGRALALDAPGCGAKRDRTTAAMGPDEIAAELVADIEAAGLKDVVLVGHSQAGTMMPLMVERRPELFRRLVYVSCIAPLPGQTLVEASQNQPGGGKGPISTGESDRQAVFRAMFCNDMTPAEANAFLPKLGRDTWPAGSYAAYDWRYDHLAGGPSTYVVCLQDAALLPDAQAVYAERFHCARVVRLDAGHQVMTTRPHTLAETLRREAACA